MNIILFGFKGCGKTHFGKLLASQLNWPFLDTDTILEEIYEQKYKYRLTPRGIYQQIGDVRFRALEREAVATLIGVDNSVIALGGGAILDPKNVELLLKIGKLVYLDASFETIRKRLKEIPAYAAKDSLQAIYEARKPIYESIPAHTIETDLLNEVGVLEQITLLIAK